MKSKYEFIADQIDGKFLRLWATVTHGVESEYEDDLFMFCCFDGI